MADRNPSAKPSSQMAAKEEKAHSRAAEAQVPGQAAAARAAVVTHDDEEEAHPKVKQRPQRPEGMPRRALTAYNFFFQEERMSILQERKERGGIAVGEDVANWPSRRGGRMARIIAARWKTIPPDRMARYKELAAADAQRHSREMEEYQRSVAAVYSEQNRKQEQEDTRVAAASETHNDTPRPDPPTDATFQHAGLQDTSESAATTRADSNGYHHSSSDRLTPASSQETQQQLSAQILALLSERRSEGHQAPSPLHASLPPQARAESHGQNLEQANNASLPIGGLNVDSSSLAVLLESLSHGSQLTISLPQVQQLLLAVAPQAEPHGIQNYIPSLRAPSIGLPGVVVQQNTSHGTLSFLSSQRESNAQPPMHHEGLLLQHYLRQQQGYHHGAPSQNDAFIPFILQGPPPHVYREDDHQDPPFHNMEGRR